MQRRDRIDGFGAASLVAFSLFLAFNQVLIKFVNAGIQPVLVAGLRSLIALLCLSLWMTWRGRPPRLTAEMALPGLLIGLIFAAEFLCLFLALDLTTVTRSAILLYSMPVWLTLAAHFLLPGELITAPRALGLVLAFAGVAWAIFERGETGGQGASLLGDCLALLAAVFWAGIALCARATRLSRLRPEMQLFWQLLVSGPVLVLAAPLFGPLIRELQPVHVAGLMVQGVAVAAAGFLFWLWLLSVYPASGVASFSFLTPIFGVALGWLVLDEPLGPRILAASGLVAAGLLMINLPRRRPAPA
ncbi:MAG: EamA/RhaT family transporter [Alphaproteobacteria bacterium HGW-Alphaproteobacteria-6]|nr:MAG: EamA/RhaT family transporter [Alphaproteobacteria bacterium HGW-Alphaproteobacteria-6]